ncbi:MAG TPA: glycosyltransferase, partial [Nitrososphaeraceae archaeon]|nr:glycosyltransferase [Nitrososphaeraceae archaeon]
MSESYKTGNKILLLYPYYWPHYKAGGPVQSLFNLVRFLKGKADFFVLSLDRDIDNIPLDQPLKKGEWIKGPNEENIYFAPSISPWLVYKIIKEVNPGVILINGIFNVNTTLPGILFGNLNRAKIIISPRGMLQDWGLKRNRFIKGLFLFLFKLLVRKNHHWHATNNQERDDIIRHFGTGRRIHIASNIPKIISEVMRVSFPDESGRIKLVFLSLINPNKNLHLIIEAVNKSEGFSLDVYGPVIDKLYWERCLAAMTDSRRVTYKSPVPAWQVTSV